MSKGELQPERPLNAIPPIEGSLVESDHFSSVLIQGGNGIIFNEVIPLNKDSGLNNLVVERFSTNTSLTSDATASQLQTISNLEEKATTGKDPAEALQEFKSEKYKK